MLRSEDYHAHITKVHRSESVLTDVPHYPNAHLAFNNAHNNPHSNERVEMVEHDQTEDDEAIFQERVDVNRAQRNPGKNKAHFELHKWKTYRP
ncbi:hypothetical protein PHAVU_003G205100 [Phaseolus vulgaris]|uniref:Uncharacterized protein n=1 Tax=Phaseolus vulgaris TaxID=3885 RepID=V7CEY5_PHAVU|nr:hypothetical protein PHAVU_003G205100g [Phaseolus vulgaris]ESW27476.1 hypothetical protein PHAVU_003G205100g [Phaseolus vulgaris]